MNSIDTIVLISTLKTDYNLLRGCFLISDYHYPRDFPERYEVVGCDPEESLLIPLDLIRISHNQDFLHLERLPQYDSHIVSTQLLERVFRPCTRTVKRYYAG